MLSALDSIAWAFNIRGADVTHTPVALAYALVNADGDILGINSAIASPTGSFAGYSYAIPSNLVQKVADDILRYGSNHRAYLGILYGSDQMREEDRQKNNKKECDWVLFMDVTQGGPRG